MILVSLALANVPILALWIAVERIEYRSRKGRRS